MTDPAGFLRRSAGWTVGLTALWGTIVSALWGFPMGLGVVLGAAVGWFNVWLLARALSGLVREPERHRPRAGSKRALPASLLIKWPIMFVLVGLALLYTPARPEGFALGALISLAAASIAGLRQLDGSGSDPGSNGP